MNTNTITSLQADKFVVSDQNLNSSAIAQGNGEKTVPILPSVRTANQVLHTREIANVEKEPSTNNDEGFKKVVKAYAVYVHQRLVGFVKKHIDPNFDDNINEEMEGWSILERNGKLHVYVVGQSPELAMLHNEWMKTEVNPAVDKELLPIVEEFGGENYSNAIFSCFVYRSFFFKYYDYSRERSRVANLNLNVNESGKIIKGFDSLINKYINDLKQIIDKKYYSLFRVLCDHQSIHVKAKFFFKHIGQIQTDAQYDMPKGCSKLMDPVYFSKVSTAACSVVKLQIFVDLLTRMKQSPKTVENLKLVLAECEGCFQYYQGNMQFYRDCQKQSPCDEVPCIRDYHEVKGCLKKLGEAFRKLIPVEIDRDDEWVVHLLPGSKKKGNGNQTGRKDKKAPIKAVSQKLAVVQSENMGKNIEVIQGPSVEAPKQEERVEMVNTIILEKELEEDDSIERETSELFESIRQLIESDRKKKLELKEAKLMKRKQEEEMVIETKPAIVKLSATNKWTLEMLFSEKSCHLELLGSEIENLIGALGGRAVPGSKNKVNIFWRNSASKAGAYEVTHGADGAGYLKSGWVVKVKEAIEVGVKLGYIAAELIHQS